MKIIKWLLMILLVAVAIGLGAVYWLFYDSRMPQVSDHPFDMESLRAEAGVISGAKAINIEVETLSYTPAPKIAIVAGTTWGEVDMVRNSYQVVFPNSSLMIDTGHSREKAVDAARYEDDAWARVLLAIASTDRIVITHGHGDHAGGLLASADQQSVIDAALVSQAQIDTMAYSSENAALFTPRLANDGLLAIAPGVVLMTARGHTPGSQMVYVQLSDGTEYIFMGDTASFADNVRLGSIRSRYVTNFRGQDDREAVFKLTAMLQSMLASAPALVLVPGHDDAKTAELVENNLLVRGFSN